MNSRMIACLRRCRYPLMLLLGALPLMLYGAYRFFPQDAARCLALVPVCALLASLCMALPGRRRLPGVIVSCALLAAVCAYALPLSSRPLLLAVPVLLCLLLLASLSLAARTVTDMSPAFYIAGVVSHLFVQALIRFARGDLRAACEATQPLLAAVFLAYLLLMLLAFNSISLDNATMARFRLPASMRHTNTLLTLAFLAAAALLAALPAVLQLIKAGIQAIRRLMRLLGDLVTWLLGEAPGGFGGGSPQPMSLFGAEAVSEEPSMFSLLIEKLVTALAVAAFAFGLFIILRFLLRRALILARRLLARLRAYAAVVSDDYSDEITDTRSEDGRRDEYLRRRRGRRTSGPAPSAPGARIRWRYARLLDRGKWASSSTARENLPQEAAALYERARYSDLPVSEEDADRFDASILHL